MAPLSAQDWLPKGAVVCYRSEFRDELLPDGTFCLKAVVTQAQFDAIVKKIGATPHTATRVYTDNKAWLQWSPEIDKELQPIKGKNRWDPQDDLSTTFVRQVKDNWEFLKYEGGFLYYKNLNH